MQAILQSAASAASSPYELYAKGQFEEAIKTGTETHSAAGYAIAARAALAEAALRDAPCLSCLGRAETLSRQAIGADPAPPDGHIWLALSLGYQARLVGIVTAKLRAYPDEARTALNAALAVDPNNSFALAALGGWHIEVVHVGGAYLARLLYGATEADALTLFDRAIRGSPESVAIRYQVGLSLAGFDLNKYRLRIGKELDSAIKGTPATFYDGKIQVRAEELLGLLKRNEDRLLAKRIHQFQGYKQMKNRFSPSTGAIRGAGHKKWQAINLLPAASPGGFPLAEE